MYKVFINDKALILMSSEEVFTREKSRILNHYNGPKSLSDAIASLRNLDTSYLVLIADNLEAMWGDFQSRYFLIDAAGGLLLNSNGESLWIKRNGKWDLPKGKVEKDEPLDLAAVREVKEECGVVNVICGHHLGYSYHCYKFDGVEVLKTTCWFRMTVLSKQNLKPQLEEGITEVSWVKKENIESYISSTYTSIAELLKREKVQDYLDF